MTNAEMNRRIEEFKSTNATRYLRTLHHARHSTYTARELAHMMQVKLSTINAVFRMVHIENCIKYECR